MKTLAGWPAERADRHSTAVLQEEPGVRLVAFTLAAGQQVPIHASGATVIATVVHGDGTFLGDDTQRVLRAGETVAYAPNEPHGMIAGAAGLRFLAVITPSPSTLARG